MILAGCVGPACLAPLPVAPGRTFLPRPGACRFGSALLPGGRSNLPPHRHVPGRACRSVLLPRGVCPWWQPCHFTFRPHRCAHVLPKAAVPARLLLKPLLVSQSAPCGLCLRPPSLTVSPAGHACLAPDAVYSASSLASSPPELSHQIFHGSFCPRHLCFHSKARPRLGCPVLG